MNQSTKVVILAGGYGTRISEETSVRPKPMVEIGGKPILWHIMKSYSSYGLNNFIICCGYKGEVIKNYFANYCLRNADVTFDIGQDKMTVHKNGAEQWKVTLVNTGDNALKIERMNKIKPYLDNKTFCLTYGDGVSNVNIEELVNFHKQQKVLATVTAVQSPGRFGTFSLEDRQTKIADFKEKSYEKEVWINGGFFVLEPGIFKYIENVKSDWEEEPLQNLAKDGQLVGFKHTGFWHPMDILRDQKILENMWQSNQAPWKVWKDK